MNKNKSCQKVENAKAKEIDGGNLKLQSRVPLPSAYTRSHHYSFASFEIAITEPVGTHFD